MGWDKDNWLEIVIRKKPAAILMTEGTRPQTLAHPGNPQQQTTWPLPRPRFPHCSLQLRTGITQPLLPAWNWCRSYSPAGTSSSQKRPSSCHPWQWPEVLKSNSGSWACPLLATAKLNPVLTLSWTEPGKWLSVETKHQYDLFIWETYSLLHQVT